MPRGEGGVALDPAVVVIVARLRQAAVSEQCVQASHSTIVLRRHRHHLVARAPMERPIVLHDDQVARHQVDPSSCGFAQRDQPVVSISSGWVGPFSVDLPALLQRDPRRVRAARHNARVIPAVPARGDRLLVCDLEVPATGRACHRIEQQPACTMYSGTPNPHTSRGPISVEWTPSRS